MKDFLVSFRIELGHKFNVNDFIETFTLFWFGIVLFVHVIANI